MSIDAHKHLNSDREGEAIDYETVHCDGCDELIIDGAPENGRIGKGYYCPQCYGEKLAALNAVMVDFHDEVRR